jgi:hypothetical protein
MSEATIRTKVGEIIAAATGAANVHTSPLRITDETEAVTAFGSGTDGDGRALLEGWWVPAASSDFEAIGRGCSRTDHTFEVVGYRTRNGSLYYGDAMTDAQAVVRALAARGAFAPISPSPSLTEAKATIQPAKLAGLPVWEVTVVFTATEHE